MGIWNTASFRVHVYKRRVAPKVDFGGAGSRVEGFGRPDFVPVGMSEVMLGRAAGCLSPETDFEGAAAAARLPRRDTGPPILGR